MPVSVEPARYRLECPRCGGDMSALDGAAALACPHCGEQYFLGADGNVGWLVPPRIHPTEALSAAKRHLREEGHRVTRIGEPRGLLVPLYWIRGLLFLWERRRSESWSKGPTGGPRATGLGRSVLGAIGSGVLESMADPPPAGDDDGWENHGSVRAYAGAIPGHPLGRLWRGKATRFASQPLDLLDPDRLPRDYELLAPALSPADAETEAGRWVDRRQRAAGIAPGARRASGELQRRLNVVAAPLVLVPFAFREDAEGAAVVDGLTGRPLAVVTGDEAHAGEEEVEPSVFARFSGPALLPLECSECGWELTLRERDRLHPCPGCGRCWELVGSERRRVRQWFLDARPGPGGRWLPFWVFDRRGPVDPSDAKPPALGESVVGGPPTSAVYVPAYAARHPEDQMMLAARLTRTPPEGTWLDEVEEFPGGAAVGSAEAEGWRFAVEGALARSRAGEFARFLAEGGASRDARDDDGRDSHERDGDAADDGGMNDDMPDDGPRGLVWLAFHREGADLVETITGARVRAVGVDPWEDRRAA